MNLAAKIISMPLPVKDNLAQSYHELSIRVQTLIDVIASKKPLTEEDKQLIEELKQRADVMADTCKYYKRILEVAEEEKDD